MRSWRRIIVAIALGAAAPSAVAAEFAEQQAIKLEQVAASLQDATIDKVDRSAPLVRDGRRYSRAAELHVKFLTCVTGVENDGKDGAMMLVIQCSGFTNVIDPRSSDGPVRDSGSDLQRARVTIEGLLDESVDTPKAKIDVPPLKHGSKFPAVQLVRDEIQRRLEFAFPGIEIEGKKRLYEKALAITNAGEEPIRVWVQHRTRTRGESGYEWHWQPGGPGRGTAVEVVVPAGQTKPVLDADQQPITGSRVRLWAESESGEQWFEHRDRDLWLVEKNAVLDGNRAYHDEKVQTFTHEIEPSTEPRVFSERIVELKNNTDERIEVDLRYRTTRAGRAAWRGQRVSVPPQQTARPSDDDGLRIRASRLLFVAESEHRLYDRHQAQPLYVIDESPEGRVYQATKIGTFVHEFDPSQRRAKVRILGNNVPIQDGTTVLARVRRGQQFEILETRGDWVLVSFEQGGATRQGWIHKRHFESVADDESNR